MKIRSRMFLLFVGTGLLIFFAAIAYLSVRYRKFTFEKTKDLAVEQVTRYSAEVRAHLDYDMGVARTMAKTLESFSHLPYDEIAPLMENFLTGILAGHRSYIDVFGQWELNHIDPTYQKKHGRLRVSYYRKDAGIVKLTDTLNVLEEDRGIYGHVKRTGRDFMTYPYYYSYTTANALPSPVRIHEEDILEATIIIPFFREGKFIGLAGMDIPLATYQEITRRIRVPASGPRLLPSPVSDRFITGSYSFLLAGNGAYLSGPGEYITPDSLVFLDESFDRKNDILNKINRGQALSLIDHDPFTNKSSFIAFSPVKIGKTGMYWSLGISFPMEVIRKDARQSLVLASLVALAGLALLAFTVWIIARSISRPLERITRVINKLSGGIIDPSDKLTIRTGDEIQQISESANHLIEGLDQTRQFADTIGSGKLDTGYTLLSDQDMMGKALVKMQENLLEYRTRIQHQADEMININRELESRRDELSKLNAMKDKFFAIIAHDLRNPFTALQSMIQSLHTHHTDLNPEDIKESLDRIHRTTKQVSGLLTNLLYWARSQSGIREINPVNIQLEKPVREAFDHISRMAENKEVTLEMTPETKELEVSADPNMLKTVLRNLISNAVKFNRKGGKVSVRAERRDGMIEVAVSDTGIGMGKEDLSRLFRIDVRPGAIGTSPEKGSGLGLIICREFVEKHRGRISAESDPGKGSTFRFTIPEASVEAPDETSARASKK